MTGCPWHCDSGEAEHFPNLQSVFDRSGELIGRGSISCIEKAEVCGTTYYVKKYSSAGKNLRRFIGRSRVRTEWESLQFFLSIGIPTARLVAYGEEKGYGYRRGALVTQEVSGSVDLAGLVRVQSPLLKDSKWVGKVIGVLSGYVRLMHQHGFVHNDLKWRNILVSSDADARIYFIDCPQGRRMFGPMLTRGVVKDLACLDKVARAQLTRSQRMRFYKTYKGVTKLSRSDKHQIRCVLRFFAGRE